MAAFSYILYFEEVENFVNFFLLSTMCIFNQEHIVRTGSGSVSVIIYGDPDKPALITYPDLALNRE